MKNILTTVIVLLFCLGATAQTNTPVGTWKTIDDGTSEAKSHVEIYEDGGKFYGKIVKLLKSDPSSVCEECSGDKKNKPVLGMIILEGLKPSDDYWKGGSILDPENGNEYGASIWFDEGKTDELQVRGKHWTGLFRTQTWYRVQ